MSTADDIRAEAIERIARSLFEADEPYSEPFEDWAARYRRKAAPFVDALGDLLPTEVDYRLDPPADCDCTECEAEALASGECVRQRRYVTAWTTEPATSGDTDA